MKRNTLIIAALLFGSGFCALVYQIVWLRSFRLIFGASTPATAAVLAIFMGGLGFGALWFGRFAQDTRRNPLRLYAHLELAISVCAAVTPLLLDLARRIYILLGGSPSLGVVEAVVIRLFLALIVLGVPVFLMGGTLPAAARAVTAVEDIGRRGLAVLYGFNALGAVLGALLPTFLLLEIMGSRWTLWLACLANLAVGIIARVLSGRLPAPDVPHEDLSTKVDAAEKDAPGETLREGFTLPLTWLLTAAFVTGFCFLLAELVWYRMAAPILGGSTYTFGLVLAIALAGIGAGGLIYSWVGPERPTPGRFAMTCALEALALMIPFAFGDDLAVFADHLRQMGSLRFSTLVLSWSMTTMVLVLPSALVAGYQFPLLLALTGRGPRNVALDVGRVYAANTLGAILGSLAGGFGLLPLLTAQGAWRLTAILLLLVGIPFFLRTLRREPLRAFLFTVLFGVTLSAMSSTGPTAVWRHSAVGAGRGELRQVSWNKQKAVELNARCWILREVEGRESALGFRYEDGLSLIVNGKSDGNVIGDAATTVLSCLIAAIQHPDPQMSFVIGLGSGQSAGWLGTVPSMKHVEVVELEPGVVEFARLCHLANQNVLDNPKISVVLGDAREVLLTSRESYDVIFSEPSNPYRAGIAGFYTADFYQHTCKRLSSNGLFVQWIQGYEVSSETFLLALATIRSVYEYVTVWRTEAGGDLMFIASKRPQVIDIEQVQSRLRLEPYRSAFGRLAGVYDVEGFIAMHVANSDLSDLAHTLIGNRLNTDDHTILEYQFARSVGMEREINLVDILSVSKNKEADWPLTRNGTFDKTRAALLRLRGWQVAEMYFPSIRTVKKNAQRIYLWKALVQDNFRSAVKLIKKLPPAPPHDLFERLVQAEALAHVPATLEERELLSVELLHLAEGGLATDAAWLCLLVSLTDKREELVPQLAREAFKAARRDPWVRCLMAERILNRLRNTIKTPAVAGEVARELLKQPFASYLLESERRYSAAELAVVAKDFETAARAFEQSEPYPKWNETSLNLRELCYQKTRPELAPRASADLKEFLAHEARTLGDLMGDNSTDRSAHQQENQ